MPRKLKIPDLVKGQIADDLKRGNNMPHMSELAEDFIREVGGCQSFAKLLWEDYKAAKPGGLMRSQIMNMILRVWRYRDDTKPPGKDLGLMTEEDLMTELADLMESDDGSGSTNP